MKRTYKATDFLYWDTTKSWRVDIYNQWGTPYNTSTEYVTSFFLLLLVSFISNADQTQMCLIAFLFYHEIKFLRTQQDWNWNCSFVNKEKQTFLEEILGLYNYYLQVNCNTIFKIDTSNWSNAVEVEYQIFDQIRKQWNGVIRFQKVGMWGNSWICVCMSGLCKS